MAKTKSAAKPKGNGAPSKSIAKKSAAKPKGIPRAPDHQHFILVDGRRLGDVKELADALEDMADHIYGHHVNAERNDFATWINDVFADAELAERVRKATGKHHAQIVLYRAVLERI